MKGKWFWILSLIAISFQPLIAQPYFNLDQSLLVKENGRLLKNAWVGGHNSVQISTVDLDLDGIQDLFVFDRTGNKVTTYINNGTADSVDYVYAPEYRPSFSFLHDWVLFRDYNCDGYQDIFTYSSGGMAVYKNLSGSTGWLNFELITPVLLSDYHSSANTPINLYVSSVDIPTLVDVDNDRDLDVLTFNIFGGTMEYHKNMSMELYNTCDSLIYELDNSCWGNFEEDANSFVVSLDISCKGITAPDPDVQNIYRHSGSCSVGFDNDGDEDIDLLLSDVSFSNLNMLTNGGDLNTANIIDQDNLFPSYDVSVDMTLFPCAYYEDVNNDNKPDLLVSPNLVNVTENFTSILYYKNIGTATAPVFEFQQNNLLQNEMIEVGDGAYPAFFDVDNDGLQDLIIGNYGYHAPGNYITQLAYYRNTGAANSPEFTLVTRDFANVSSLNLKNIIPTFGDIDDDGVDEMLIGEYSGKLHLFENSANVGQPANFSLAVPNYKNIDIGSFAAPQLFDVDGDDKLDMIIGEKNGKLKYYHNNGPSNDPDFELVSDTWGGVDVRQQGAILGFSTPFMFNYGSELRLLVGSENGGLFMYTDIEANLTDTFALVSSNYQDIWEGERSAINGTDLDNDGYIDFVIGNYCGGVTYFRGDTTFAPPISVAEIETLKFEIYPNPANDILNLDFGSLTTSGIAQTEVYDLAGKKILSQQILPSGVVRLNISGIADGLYLIRISSGDNTTIKKFVVKH